MSVNQSESQDVFEQSAGVPLPHTPLLHEPGVQAIVTNFHDFTERKHAEEAQRLLAAIVASSADAIVSKTLDGVITSWNDAAARIFGYAAEEAIGRHISLIIPPELQSEEEEIIAKLRKGMRIEHFETVRVTKDGRTIDVSLSISPVKDAQGAIVGAAKIARDITDRKRAEERQHLLHTASDLLASSLDHQVTLREIAGLIVPSLPRDAQRDCSKQAMLCESAPHSNFDCIAC
jgi:PAS domain S-box-containing protein